MRYNHSMKLIVGLGNPGKEYQTTRHNIGFMAIDQLLRDLECPPMGFENKLKSEIIGGRYPLSAGQTETLLLVRPQTFMNQSGEAVKLAFNYYKNRLTVEDLWVVHDDVDLPLGQIKIQLGGGTSGHHGLDSIAQAIGFGFIRFRLGIGRPKKGANDVYDFVLEPFPSEAKPIVDKVLSDVSQAILLALKDGLSMSMSRYNG